MISLWLLAQPLVKETELHSSGSEECLDRADPT